MRKIAEKRYEQYSSCDKYEQEFREEFQKIFDLINKQGVVSSSGPSSGYHYPEVDGQIDRNVYFLLAGTSNPVSICLSSRPIFGNPKLEVSIDDRFAQEGEKKKISELEEAIKNALSAKNEDF